MTNHVATSESERHENYDVNLFQSFFVTRLVICP